MQNQNSFFENTEANTDWWVYSTAVEDGAILVENRTTKQLAVVSDPTRAEWDAAFHAPSNPYRWPYPERLITTD